MMHLLLLFFVTFSAGFMATVPPGLLNMNAAKISVEKGKQNGVLFSLGVSTMIMLQSYVAVLISKFFYKNPEVIEVLLKVAFFVFIGLAIYFFIAGKKQKPKTPIQVAVSKKNSYFKGLFLAGINLLTIPYYSGLHAMWKQTGWIKFEATDIITFVLASGLGTFAVMYLYTFYFNKLELKTNRFGAYANYTIAILMVVLSVITAFRIFM